MRPSCCRLIILLAALASTAAECPARCVCVTTQITCPADAVTRIPNIGGNDTRNLNIGRNRLAQSSLSSRDFAHLTKLEELALSNCGLEFIEPNTFNGKLQVARVVLLLASNWCLFMPGSNVFPIPFFSILAIVGELKSPTSKER